MSLREHTSHEFEVELESVRQKIFEMGRHVDQVLESAGKALMAGDSELGERIIAGDDETDSMELEIDHLCLEILARRQPVAGDLRLLTSALKLVIDLERIGDLGVSIAGRVVELGREPPLIPYEDLLRMMTTAREMLAEAMEALKGQDVARASRVIDKDEVGRSEDGRVTGAHRSGKTEPGIEALLEQGKVALHFRLFHWAPKRARQEPAQ